jgi:squalene synthase HpnC
MSTASDYLSGKTHRDENFPVASRLIAARHRAPIMAFYRYVRTADDVADNAGLSGSEKLRLLDALDDALTGNGPPDPAAEPLRAVLAETGLTNRHALDLIAAFRRDARKSRYESWAELIDYCRLSAMPVGRFVLDVHGEDQSTWAASDAVCAALQVINHAQDCGKDYHLLDRVYMPADMLAEHGASVADIAAGTSSPALRAFLDDVIVRCRELLDESAALPHQVRDRRLATEIAVIRALAYRQLKHLESHDPLAGRGRPNKLSWLATAAAATLAHKLGWSGGRGAAARTPAGSAS